MVLRSAIDLHPSGAAGPAPLIATWLFRTFQSTTAITVYIALCAATTFVATAATSDHAGADTSEEYRMPRSRARM